MSGGTVLPSTLVRGIEQLEPMPVTAQRLVALMQGEDVSLARIAELFGVNHAVVGAAIAVEWHFPDVVTDAIARHHDAQLGTSTPVLDAVVIANMVAKNIGVGLGAEGFNLAVDSECVHRLGLDFTRFARVCLQTDTWLRELRAQNAAPVQNVSARR